MENVIKPYKIFWSLTVFVQWYKLQNQISSFWLSLCEDSVQKKKNYKETNMAVLLFYNLLKISRNNPLFIFLNYLSARLC